MGARSCTWCRRLPSGHEVSADSVSFDLPGMASAIKANYSNVTGGAGAKYYVVESPEEAIRRSRYCIRALHGGYTTTSRT